MEVRRSWWKRLLIVIAVLATVLFISPAVALHFLLPYSKDWVVNRIAQQYKTNVALESLSITVFPEITAIGKKLVIQGRQDSKTPFISIEEFSARTHFFDLLWNVKRVRTVELKGLQINVPRHEDTSDSPKNKTQEPAGGGPHARYVIDELNADGTVLRILPKEAAREPLEFDLEQLRMHSVGVDQPMQFQAILTNPKPPGEIHTAGSFGPWQVDHAENTPVSGKYTFSNADLSIFKGISGILSSEGQYSGVLERIQVDGTTDTPAFTVRASGNPVHLKTQFEAIVDGTNGDTYLQPVRAEFEHTVVVAKGAVHGKPEVDGKTVTLDVDIQQGRLEDLMRLAVKNRAPLTGDVKVKAQFVLPPGDREVIEKLQLRGQFDIKQAHFTELNIQQKIADLSRRGSGKPKDIDQSAESVVSQMSGALNLKNGVAQFSDLKFQVPGAGVDLHGSFALITESLAFRGHLLLDVPLSQTVTGWRSTLLKVADPFFRNGKGTSLPIKIGGTRSAPSFGLNFGGGNN